MWYFICLFGGMIAGFTLSCLLVAARGNDEVEIPTNVKPLTDNDLDDLETEINLKKEKANESVEQLDPKRKASVYNDYLADRRRKHKADL